MDILNIGALGGGGGGVWRGGGGAAEVVAIAVPAFNCIRARGADGAGICRANAAA